MAAFKNYLGDPTKPYFCKFPPRNLNLVISYISQHNLSLFNLISTNPSLPTMRYLSSNNHRLFKHLLVKISEQSVNIH